MDNMVKITAPKKLLRKDKGSTLHIAFNNSSDMIRLTLLSEEILHGQTVTHHISRRILPRDLAWKRKEGHIQKPERSGEVS